MNPKFFWLLTAFVLVSIRPVGAQQPNKIPRIGFLSASSEIDGAFLDGLRQLGYVDKKTILIEHRSGNGKLDRLPELANELVNAKVDLIVTQGTPAAQAAKKATATIPIVMATTGDAIRTGLVASLAAPGGNITGLSFLAPDMSTRRLELFKEALPKITSVAMLINPDISTEIGFKILQDDAPKFSVNVRMFELRDLTGLDGALSAARRERFQAAILPPNSSYIPERQYIVSIAAKHRIPLMYDWRDFPEAGGLMSYGVSLSDLFRRAATYVDKILKGTRPADLPIEQPIKFELIINLNTAKQLDLTISPNVLARADRVIK
jgi:putative tryptophan/tyrosine transport system substrate-binding protein